MFIGTYDACIKYSPLKKSLYFLNYLKNFNEVFWKDGAYSNISSSMFGISFVGKLFKRILHKNYSHKIIYAGMGSRTVLNSCLGNLKSNSKKKKKQ